MFTLFPCLHRINALYSFMRDFQESNKVRRFLASRFVLALLFLVVMGMGVATFRALEKGWQAEEQRKVMEANMQQLQHKKAELAEEVKNYSTGEGVEREAREKLNLHKPGEKVVVILNNDTHQQEPMQTQSWVQRMWSTIRSWLGN